MRSSLERFSLSKKGPIFCRCEAPVNLKRRVRDDPLANRLAEGTSATRKVFFQQDGVGTDEPLRLPRAQGVCPVRCRYIRALSRSTMKSTARSTWRESLRASEELSRVTSAVIRLLHYPKANAV